MESAECKNAQFVYRAAEHEFLRYRVQQGVYQGREIGILRNSPRYQRHNEASNRLRHEKNRICGIQSYTERVATFLSER